MRVKMYQINLDRDINGAKWQGIDPMGTDQELPKIDASIYDEVFNAEMDYEGLQHLFVLFNTTGHPLFRGNSMFVSDVALPRWTLMSHRLRNLMT